MEIDSELVELVMGYKKGAIASLILSLLFSACSAKFSDIDVVETSDLGTVPKGELAKVEVPVRNLGNAPLKVEAIATSCGCTTATLSSMTIPPGGEATLHVEYDSNAHEADMGAIARSVFISSNDPDEGDKQIQINVMVQPKS